MSAWNSKLSLMTTLTCTIPYNPALTWAPVVNSVKAEQDASTGHWIWWPTSAPWKKPEQDPSLRLEQFLALLIVTCPTVSKPIPNTPVPNKSTSLQRLTWWRATKSAWLMVGVEESAINLKTNAATCTPMKRNLEILRLWMMSFRQRLTVLSCLITVISRHRKKLKKN